MNSGTAFRWTDPTTWPWMIWVWLAIMGPGDAAGGPQSWPLDGLHPRGRNSGEYEPLVGRWLKVASSQ